MIINFRRTNERASEENNRQRDDSEFKSVYLVRCCFFNSENL